jgi:uncharacterized membrane protein YhaH (DUF805 family)
MQALRFIFFPSGRLSPEPFIIAAGAAYVLGVASQWLTVPAVIDRAGLWPFVVGQVLLIWVWYALHAKRLHDGGRRAGAAAGVAVLYALSVVLLIVVAASFFNTGEATDLNSASALGLILFVLVVSVLLGSPHYDLAWAVVAILTAVALVPVIVAVIFTLWAARLPTRSGPLP